MIDGVKLRLGGADWIVPPLTLGQMRRLWPTIHKIGAAGVGMGEEEIDALAEVVCAALCRNYPDMTLQKVVDELLDLGNSGAALRAVLTGSGLVSGAGEAMPAERISDGDSAGSMPSLLQAAGTPSP